MPRPLELLDLPTLYRNREHALSLDSARLLTRGNPLSAMGMVAYLNPIRHIYSAVSTDDGISLLGGIIHTLGDPFAKLLYLAPDTALDSPSLPSLIEYLSAEAGGWGVFHVLAEVDEDSVAFEALRKSGFSVYAWQRFWDVSHITPSATGNGWVRAQSINLPAIQSLYHQIVPPLLQPIEPTPRRAVGMVCPEGARCYVNLSYGMNGIVLTPLIHPEATGVPEKLSSLLNHLPDRRGRNIYACVRSYQAWLEPVLEDLGAKPSQRQAVMVKHLARMVKDAVTAVPTQPVNVIPASHISRVETKK